MDCHGKPPNHPARGSASDHVRQPPLILIPVGVEATTLYDNPVHIELSVWTKKRDLVITIPTPTPIHKHRLLEELLGPHIILVHRILLRTLVLDVICSDRLVRLHNPFYLPVNHAEERASCDRCSGAGYNKVVWTIQRVNVRIPFLYFRPIHTETVILAAKRRPRRNK
jgi:hypothetical protein